MTTRPNVTMTQKAVSANDASRAGHAALGREVERRPVAAERFDHAVEQHRAAAYNQKRPRQAARGPGRVVRQPQGAPQRADQKHRDSSTHQQRQRPPGAEAVNSATSSGCQRRADAEQRVQQQHRPVGALGEEALDQRVQCHHGGAEAETRALRWRRRAGRTPLARRSAAGWPPAAPWQADRRRGPAAARRAGRSVAPAAGRMPTPRIASTTCGMNIAPYCVPDRSKPVGLAKIVLAAGKVTSARPCKTPASIEQPDLEPAGGLRIGSGSAQTLQQMVAHPQRICDRGQ